MSSSAIFVFHIDKQKGSAKLIQPIEKTGMQGGGYFLQNNTMPEGHTGGGRTPLIELKYFLNHVKPRPPTSKKNALDVKSKASLF
jgi:hypothetical protein